MRWRLALATADKTSSVRAALSAGAAFFSFRSRLGCDIVAMDKQDYTPFSFGVKFQAAT